MEGNKSLMMDIQNDLSKKTFEELVYIYYNQEHYVSEFTQAGRLKNQELLLEVKKLNDIYEDKKAKYNNLKADVEKLLFQLESKEQELKSGSNSNNNFKSSYNLDNLIKDIENYIQIKLKAPKDQLIKSFMNKEINQNEFEEQFKNLSSEYHYYNIILQKLYQLKRLQ